jgi:heme/copper-type cytochrome/quinol oxidase subunit 2
MHQKTRILIIFLTLIVCLIFLNVTQLSAQCSICTKNAQQLGDKAGKGLNLSILFLAFTPLILIAFLGYRWWKNNEQSRNLE